MRRNMTDVGRLMLKVWRVNGSGFSDRLCEVKLMKSQGISVGVGYGMNSQRIGDVKEKLSNLRRIRRFVTFKQIWTFVLNLY